MNAPNFKKPSAGASAPVDIDLLKTFMAIVETKSFTKAAEMVFRTPSAVSMQMKKMEEILGRSVFQRDSRSVSLTPDGEVLMSYAKSILDMSNEMMARFVMPEMEGTVCLGAPDDYGARIMPQVLKRFAQTHPHVQVNVVIETSENLIKRFETGQLDVMVYTAQSDAMEANARVLLEEDLVWAGVRGGSAWERDPLPLSMWEGGCAWRGKAIDALSKKGRSFRVAYMTAHTLAQRAAIESDLAIAPFPASFIEEPLIVLGDKQGLPPLGKYQIRMRMKEDAGCCSHAVADHVAGCFEAMS